MTRTATRSEVIALREERRAMREGTAFLDEKCLLLAAAMVSELRALEALEREAAPLREAAARLLRLAAGRHGLEGLRRQPPLEAGTRRVAIRTRSLLGVALQEASVEGEPGPAAPAANPSPELRECRAAHAALAVAWVRRAAMSANLARLQAEYRRTVRRVRALEDVVLPEIERDLGTMEATLGESEQDEALWARFGKRRRLAE
jgi:V/A-type H+-transporting ATPase subunit D